MCYFAHRLSCVGTPSIHAQVELGHPFLLSQHPRGSFCPPPAAHATAMCFSPPPTAAHSTTACLSPHAAASGASGGPGAGLPGTDFVFVGGHFLVSCLLVCLLEAWVTAPVFQAAGTDLGCVGGPPRGWMEAATARSCRGCGSLSGPLCDCTLVKLSPTVFHYQH